MHSSPLLQKIKIIIVLLALIAQTSQPIFVFASATQNNNQGFYQVDFNGNQQGVLPDDGGIFRSNILVNTVAGNASIDPSFTSGFFTSFPITPNSFSGWNKIFLDIPTLSNITDATVSLHACNSVPDPIPLWQNMSLAPGGPAGPSGNPTYTLSLLGLDEIAYPCIQVRVDLQKTTGNFPIVNDLKVTWTPLPVFLIN